MKVRYFVQAGVYCLMVLGSSFASASDVDYTIAEQRLRDLEMRVDSLEAAGNEVNLAGFQSCDSCCGEDVGCASSCCKRSSWVRPCPAAEVDLELLLFAVNDSEAENNDTQNSLKAGLRIGYSRVNEKGRVLRLRYFNFGSTLEGGFNRYEMEEIDAEIGRRFALIGGLKGEFTAGVRFAAFSEHGNLEYDSSFGPLVSLQLRGRKFVRGTSFVNLRHSWQFGDASDAGAPDRPGTFNISEAQLGLEWQRPLRMATFVLRTAAEVQYWSGLQDGDSEDIGLYGLAASFGLSF